MTLTLTMRDSEIEQWVLNEIKLATNGRLKEVCVLALNGVVDLNGTVKSRSDKLAAQTAAERAKGVMEVINHLSLRKRKLVRRRVAAKSQVASVSGSFHFPIRDISEVRTPPI